MSDIISKGTGKNRGKNTWGVDTICQNKPQKPFIKEQ